jgi:hypothetical protein
MSSRSHSSKSSRRHSSPSSDDESDREASTSYAVARGRELNRPRRSNYKPDQDSNEQDNLRPSCRSSRSKPLLPQIPLANSRPRYQSPQPSTAAARPPRLISYSSLLPQSSSLPTPQAPKARVTRMTTSVSLPLPSRASPQLSSLLQPSSSSSPRSAAPYYDERFDMSDSDWRAQEYSSSPSSSESSSSDASDSESDEDTDYTAVDAHLFPAQAPKPPRMPKRVPIWPVATKSRKRASLKEAYRRRFGMLFPSATDSVEEKQTNEKMCRSARYRELVTPVESRSVPPKKGSRKVQRQRTIEEDFEPCSQSSSPSSSTITRSSSEESLSTAPTSCTSSPSPILKDLPAPERDTSSIKPTAPLLTPVPASECPLTLHLISIESAKFQQEEAAFQASLKPKVVPVVFPWTPIQWTAEGVALLEKAEGKKEEVKMAATKEEVESWSFTLIRFGQSLSKVFEESAPLPTSSPSPTPAPSPLFPNSFCTPLHYGYRVHPTQIKLAFEPFIPPTCVSEVQFEFYPPRSRHTDRDRRSSRSRSSKRRSNTSTSERDERKRQHFVEDDRFYRVLAMENSMRATCDDAMMRDYESFGRDLKVNKAWDVLCHGNVRYPHLRKMARKESLLRNQVAVA